MSMRNIRLRLAYDGTAYAGWQRQPLPQGMTVQYRLEQALSALFREQIVVTGAGRTDSGVHALGQTANFYCHKPVPVENIPLALNHKLPPDIRVLSAEEVPMSFHARYDAKSKTYRYLIQRQARANPFTYRYAWTMEEDLDAAAMRQGAGYLLGSHDSRHYAASGVSASHFVRNITELRIDEPPQPPTLFPWEYVCRPLTVTVTADGFLYRMVRLITCRLAAVGLGKIPPEAMADFLQGWPGPNIAMAPAQGLTLMEVEY